MPNRPAHRLAAPALPGWAMSLFERGETASMCATRIGDSCQMQSNDSWTIATITLEAAGQMNASHLQQSVTRTYLQLLDQLRKSNDHKPVRFWNYVPRMLDEAQAGRDRYMMFNAGRHDAFVQWFDSQQMSNSLVAASAVDHGGDDLHIHMLACGAPHRPVENPRQCPAYQYSPRYGPVPPSFARATLIEPLHEGDPLRLITAGTASVLGEDSHHHSDVRLQLDETLTNLAVLIAQALPDSKELLRRIEQDIVLRNELLAHAAHVRAYVPHAHEQMMVDRGLREALPSAQTIELMPAVLCRKNLRVEIEILAEIELSARAGEAMKQTHP